MLFINVCEINYVLDCETLKISYLHNVMFHKYEKSKLTHQLGMCGVTMSSVTLVLTFSAHCWCEQTK